jgi:O-acetyl-ADP-ribose deacetylase (regulator of RNase III)
MTALSADRNTPQRSGDNRNFPVKGAATLYAGGLAAIDATGMLVPAASVAALKIVGRNERQIINTGADGDVRADVKAGIFRFNNSTSTDAIALTDIGADCYAVDDQTVAKTSNSSARPVAGKIFDVDAQGVWVKIS